jgi:putative FmdB family regulatory protein
MPLYEYQCMKCGDVFEILLRLDQEWGARCPACHGEAKRILSPSHFVLKGSGFYVNDYPSESKKKAESKGKESEKPAPAKEKKAEKAAS